MRAGRALPLIVVALPALSYRAGICSSSNTSAPRASASSFVSSMATLVSGKSREKAPRFRSCVPLGPSFFRNTRMNFIVQTWPALRQSADWSDPRLRWRSCEHPQIQNRSSGLLYIRPIRRWQCARRLLDHSTLAARGRRLPVQDQKCRRGVRAGGEGKSTAGNRWRISITSSSEICRKSR
jgi:hypothetical protein